MRIMTLTIAASSLSVIGGATPAFATVGWAVHTVADPTHVSSNDAFRCETEEKCDRYQLLVTNAGDEPSAGTVTVTDKLPRGINPTFAFGGSNSEEVSWNCSTTESGTEEWVVSCEFPASIPAGGIAPFVQMVVSAPTPSMAGSLTNEVSVTGGGTAAVTKATVEVPISSETPPFEISDFQLEADGVGGASDEQAGAHPWQITTSFGVPAIFTPEGIRSSPYKPVENVKDIVAELPPGVVGDPRVVPQCTQTQLRANKCPTGSRVGVIAFRAGLLGEGEFHGTGDQNGCCSAVYNMVPEGGYPAELAFSFATIPIYLYVDVVHSGSGYHLRITSPGVPAILETEGVIITLFGDPGKLNTGSAGAAFLTNPVNCSAGPLSSRIETESWENPGHPVSRETTTYPTLTGCNLLQFNPSLALMPSTPSQSGTSEADEPSAYTVDLNVPQTSSFSELATPELKDATLTLPQGVSISPPAAQGLAGCRAEGPEGINIGSNKIGAGGRDEGDPEATELGAGHAGGNGSPYDDDFYHTAKGHCPGASTLGTVEVFTPLLPTRCGGEGQPACKPGESQAPLQGDVYLAQPKCGGKGQPVCTEASATNGELFGLYIEAEGSGVIVKLAGTVAADPSTDQLTATFNENPQLPFSELKLHLHGGPRAPLANPQVCGSFATTSTLTSWAGQEASGSSPHSASTGTARAARAPRACRSPRGSARARRARSRALSARSR